MADFQCWTYPEVVILGADQKHQGLWGQEWHITKANPTGKTFNLMFNTYM